MLHRAILAGALALVVVSTAAGRGAVPLPGASSAPACKTATIPYPQNALAAAAGSLWIACRDARRIERRSAGGKLSAVVRTPGFAPWAVAAAGGAVWAVDRDQAVLLRISTRTNRIAARIRLSEPPIYVWGASGGVWLAFDGSGTVGRVDAQTGRVMAPTRVGDGPSGLAARGSVRWVLSHRDGALVRFDGKAHTTLATQAADERRTPERMAVAGSSLWLTGRGLDLERVDPGTGAALGTTEIGAAGIDVVAVGSRIAVVVATPTGARRGDPVVASVAFVDAASGAVVRRLATAGAVSSTGTAVLGGRLVLLDGLHGRFLTVR